MHARLISVECRSKLPPPSPMHFWFFLSAGTKLRVNKLGGFHVR
jgi:hypothetical protein